MKNILLLLLVLSVGCDKTNKIELSQDMNSYIVATIEKYYYINKVFPKDKSQYENFLDTIKRSDIKRTLSDFKYKIVYDEKLNECSFIENENGLLFKVSTSSTDLIRKNYHVNNIFPFNRIKFTNNNGEVEYKKSEYREFQEIFTSCFFSTMEDKIGDCYIDVDESKYVEILIKREENIKIEFFDDLIKDKEEVIESLKCFEGLLNNNKKLDNIDYMYFTLKVINKENLKTF